MKHLRTWSDLYGSACAEFEGRAGGPSWLVAAPPERAADLPAALEALDAKGRVLLLVHEGVTPLLSALREWQPRGLLVAAPAALSGGPALTLPGRTVELGGVPYAEGGPLPAWHAALDLAGPETPHGENAAASAAASVGVPVAVVGAADLGPALYAWMGAVPHGR